MKSDINLIPILKEFGVYDVFDEHTSNLSKLAKLKVGKHLYVNIFKQKTKIDVNESGTKAAAATIATHMGTMAFPGAQKQPKIIKFYADHPFAFMIVDNKTNNIIFMGQYVNP